MPGPPPKPTEQKRLAGNPGHQKLPAPLIVLEGTVDRIPDPPEALGANGKRRWTDVWSVANKWLVPLLDLELLMRYCEGFDERTYWQGVIKRQGRMAEGSMRQPKVHPAVEELHKLDDRLTRWESELGFTPIGRTRLHVEKRNKEPERKLAKYIG